jgi:NAD(P)-dependent dehydrogenase (short-subunit alcohol dehydrogenase family)
VKNCIILGANSEIGDALGCWLEAQGWAVFGWTRYQSTPRHVPFDLVISAIGTVAPVGLWHHVADADWTDSITSNLTLPVSLLREIWPYRRPDASVCFLAGSNPNKVMPGYSAYNAGKMALLKVVEQLDAETPDAKFFALGPGYIPTKIHKPTIDANWPNERIAKGGGTPIEKVYDCLKWCVAQDKAVIGGRNICVSDPYGDELAVKLKSDTSLFKLRRVE